MAPILTGIIASQITGHLSTGPDFLGSYDALASVTVPSGGVASVTFSGIPSNYTHFQIRAIIRSSTAATLDTVKFNFNQDTGTNYMRHALYGDGSTASSIASATSATYASFGDVPAASATANSFGTYILDVLDYGNSNKYKTTRALGGYELNGSGSVDVRSNLWVNMSPIVSLVIATTSGSNIAQYSSFALYGVK